jgi:3-oxoacyl-[acyl-carrier protein] reductase
MLGPVSGGEGEPHLRRDVEFRSGGDTVPAIASGMTFELRTPELGNEHVNAAIAATPAGRWGEPEEVAALALFLASDEASFVHGAPMLVDGGWTLS